MSNENTTRGENEAKSSVFDDYDFSQVKTRRELAKLAKENAKDEAEKPLMMNMDQDLSNHNSSHNDSNVGGKKVKRPNLVLVKAKTTGTTGTSDTLQQQRKKNFFGFGKDSNNQNNNDYVNELPIYERTMIDMTPISIGSKTITVWPYDDYHLVQKLYYENLVSAMNKNRMPSASPTETKSNKPSTAAAAAAAALEQQQQQSSIPIFSRPADPTDIPTAVQGLSLTVFESKAEERAIAIVSTWLFDVGLIDELLVNGGMTGNYHKILDNKLNGGDDKSVQTSEGVEVGSHGFPIEGSTKMDKEIMKLRNSTRRQLALINARLNDGVAATGSEVQELVNAVVVTKDDIGRLRELSTYVSNANDVANTNQFMLTKYPKLKQAINARRNLARCFRELDFFAQIPSTCDRLREELHAGEWTVHEWSSLRSVAREHVELEIFLVEAEAGMKKRLYEEEAELSKDNSTGRKANRRASNSFGRSTFQQNGLGNMASNNSLIDRFLEEHVQNVWELGDEIRLRLMSGISTAFDLAMNNPAGMVALVEAVEVYETANSDYKAVHGEEAGKRNQKLGFTDMRAAALAELYKDFESRGLDVFRELTTQAADIAEEEEAANKQFSAVLRASNELASEIGIVREQMAPCFPPNWCIAVLWTTCVAHVCSTNILQQIGGPDGQKLPDLTVTQLLDLVAWVENFREIIQESFPQIGSIASKRTYLHQSPKLLQDNSKTIDIELAQDSLAWVNNTLWDVHDLAKDEFLLRTTEQTEAWLDNVYEYVQYLCHLLPMFRCHFLYFF
jgi:Exocyst complex component Sec6